MGLTSTFVTDQVAGPALVGARRLEIMDQIMDRRAVPEPPSRSGSHAYNNP